MKKIADVLGYLGTFLLYLAFWGTIVFVGLWGEQFANFRYMGF